MVHHIAGWWDSFELWVAGLPFIPQFLVVLVGMVPICFAIAFALDRVLRVALRMFDRGHGDGPAVRVPADAAALTADPDAVLLPGDPRRPVQSGVR
ncbi:hypothetical protein F5X71_09285 [Nocardia brasiliensis]|uniref:Uncharacterized protein n=1 Tax=Nocardia brasiliensis TaxID=37326 RepID=A0A6G9XNL2_NOCBR|nr:hypothetical protein [Nocardia brasiliensis]QIS02489.1 hypothetical protein F5X71_09285 [Nocardia brasiliensis]